MVNPQVLVVDDEPGIQRLLELEFSTQGFEARFASCAQDALEQASERWPDLVVADIVMEGMDGLELMRRLRSHGSLRVILLTARTSDADRVYGLELGADDYVCKPFSPRELSARVRAVLRRNSSDEGHVVQVGDLKLDFDGHRALRGDQDILLTRTEWRLLEALATNAGRVMLSGELLSRVWAPGYRSDLQYLRGWISSLRRKLEQKPASPRLIRTVVGVGYMFEAASQQQTSPAVLK